MEYGKERRKAGTLPDGVLIDEEDRHLLEGYNWHLDPRTGHVSGHKIVYLHRLVINATAGLQVDHINHNPKDNRKCNLRLVTEKFNHQNQRKRGDNKSGFRGVHFCSKYNGRLKKPWLARAEIDGKQVQLGYYKTPEEAGEAARKWRLNNMPGALS